MGTETSVARAARRSRLILRSAVLVGVTAALAAILVFRLQAAQRQVGNAATVRPPAATDLAPDFTLRTWAWWDDAPGARVQPDQTFQLAALRGQPVVVNFWASWCEACRAEAGTLEAAWQRYRARGVRIVGVDIEDAEQDGKAFLQQYRITYFNGPDATDTITVAYAAASIPLTVFVDPRGTITGRHVGAIDAAGLDHAVAALLAARDSAGGRSA